MSDNNRSEKEFHNESDHALTARMIARAPRWAAGAAGIFRVLLKDSVTAILALSAVMISINAMNQDDLERRHAEAIATAKEQTEITRTLAAQVAAFRGEIDAALPPLQAAVNGLGSRVDYLDGRVDDHQRAIDAIFSGHPNERARYEQLER